MSDGLLVDRIENLMGELQTEYQKSQGLILSESDLKLHIFMKLYPLFEHDEETLDFNIYGSPLHSELPFFEVDNTLKFRPDICILQTKNLSIFHSVDFELANDFKSFAKMSGKGCEFGGDAIIIELKFCKNKYGIGKKELKSYNNDIKKIKHLQVVAYSKGLNFYGILIIFNKTDKGKSKIDDLDLSNSDNFKIIYGTGNVKF